jgi:hypothetical protein
MNIRNLFKKEEVKKQEAYWEMIIIFTDKTRSTITAELLPNVEVDEFLIPKEMTEIINWYENPDSLAIKSFQLSAGLVVLDADLIHHITVVKR